MRGATHELTSKVVFTVAYNPNAASKGGMERGCARAGRVQGRGGSSSAVWPRSAAASVATACGRKIPLTLYHYKGQLQQGRRLWRSCEAGCVCVCICNVCMCICMYVYTYVCMIA